MTRQRRAPLWEAVLAYQNERIIPLHTPGHKQGKGRPAGADAWLGRNIFPADLTEVGGLDNLLEPGGVIQEAEALTAELFGADRSFFLVNGTLAGFYAMLAALGRPGSTVLAARNIAPAAAAGLRLSGVSPVFLQPETDSGYHLALGVSPATVAAALEIYPDARAVLLAGPALSGALPAWGEIARLCHRHNICLLADETYGAHLYLGDGLPPGALAQGADAAIHFPGLFPGHPAQGAWLHTKGGRIDPDRLRSALQLIQSTSPSYVTMSALDRVRQRMAVGGQAEMAELVAKVRAVREEIESFPGIVIWGDTVESNAALYQRDPLTLTCVLPRTRTAAGRADELDRLREELAPVPVSAVGPTSLVLRPQIGNNIGDLRRASRTLGRLGQLSARAEPEPVPWLPGISEAFPVRPPGQPTGLVDCRRAAGRTLAQRTVIRPPDVWIGYPGETVSPAMVAALDSFRYPDRAGEVPVRGPVRLEVFVDG